jgi:ABC-type transporter MlaC component
MKAQVVSGFFVLAIVSVPLWGWAAETPTNTVKKLVDSVRSYKKENSTSSSQDRAANLQAQKVAEETLAIADLAKRVIGP